MLSTRDLVAGYDERTVLDGLDLDLPTDAFTVIVGPNACGKSTLLRTMARLLTPRRGTVLLDGTAIRELPTREVARRLGVLPQSPLVPEGVTVADLVGRGRQPYQRWWRQWSSEDGAAVDQAMALADVTDLADRPVDSLSGGQRQRVWIAMTLAQDTDALLLDEPTTFLDLAHQVEVLDLLHRLRSERGRTVVAVLHDLNQAARYADHLVAMRAGAVVAAGPPREILTADLVRDVFGLACVVVPCPVTGAPLVVPAYTGGNAPAPAAASGGPVASPGGAGDPAAASAGAGDAAAASAGAGDAVAASAGVKNLDSSTASVPDARPATGDAANPLAGSHPSKGL
ncbi:Spermidine/putrescine import ATP-binding protein PotA [Micromonospora saelicesensis]|nr:Spermidine/putrescine import ATP-binding protein PotA [Micromonospora saelicesensis]RAO51164.1 Spermidine/putrescine import ATP-binding protein PotA [Micromonospora saelicesensis]RAO60544.1 Spermidine/putrescine import ATP-binding protein PotA [Micromonospora saelicesensis]